MWELFKQKGIKKVIEVPFEVTIDKNLKTNLDIDKEIKSPGFLNGKNFKGIIRYDPKNLVRQRGGTSINLTGKYGAELGLLSIAFDFINLETGSGMKRFSEKDDKNEKPMGIFPTLLFVGENLEGLYFFVGDIYVDPFEDSNRKNNNLNKAGFGFYRNPRDFRSKIFTFFAKNGTLSGHGKVKFDI